MIPASGSIALFADGAQFPFASGSLDSTGKLVVGDGGNLSIGVRIIVGKYGGDANYNPADNSANPLEQDIEVPVKVTPTVTVTSNASPAAPGTVQFTIVVA